jgi:hypothetical protein
MRFKSVRRLSPSEKAITAAIIGHWRLARTPSTLVAAIPNMGAFGQAGLTAGLPDFLVIGPNGVGFIELKKEFKANRELRTKEQCDFAELCAIREIPYALAFGRDEPIEVLQRWGVIK